MIPIALRDADAVDRFGGKAASLSASLREGLPVPDGFALSVEHVEAISAGDAGAIASTSGLINELGGRVAVRSSAVDEDSTAASFAGQHLTVLNVTTDEGLRQAVTEVRASGFSTAAAAYRERVGAAMEAHVAVVVQRLVDPECAGVLFTRNPMTGAEEYVVECAWGLGEVVVSGLVTPDHVRATHGGDLLEYRRGHKDLMLIAGANGTVEVDVAPERVEAPCLDQARLSALFELAQVCERIFGGPQDLEWAIVDEQLVLLQSRAVTTGGES